jgi:hypothetical protein
VLGQAVDRHDMTAEEWGVTPTFQLVSRVTDTDAALVQCRQTSGLSGPIEVRDIHIAAVRVPSGP